MVNLGFDQKTVNFLMHYMTTATSGADLTYSGAG